MYEYKEKAIGSKCSLPPVILTPMIDGRQEWDKIIAFSLLFWF